MHGRIGKAARQAKMQAKDGMQARTIGTAGETVRAKAKTGKRVVSPKNGKPRTDRTIGAHQGGKARAARKANEAGDIDWWAQSDGSQHRSKSEEEIHFCTLSESKVQNQRHEARQKEDVERGWTQGKFQKERKHRQRRGVNTRNRYQALNILETIREEDEPEEPKNVFDKSDIGRWIREEAVVDSGAVECVTTGALVHCMRERTWNRDEAP